MRPSPCQPRDMGGKQKLGYRVKSSGELEPSPHQKQPEEKASQAKKKQGAEEENLEASDGAAGAGQNKEGESNGHHAKDRGHNPSQTEGATYCPALPDNGSPPFIPPSPVVVVTLASLNEVLYPQHQVTDVKGLLNIVIQPKPLHLLAVRGVGGDHEEGDIRQ